MIYELKSPVLGFENMGKVEFEKMDDMFAKIRDAQNPAIELTLVNPYVLREYSFDIPKYIQLLLEINESSKLNVYNVVVMQKPVENSKVNFLAPIVFNEDNHYAAQLALSIKDYPDFKVADELRKYMKD